MLSVRAISRAKRVNCPGYIDEETSCDHDEACGFPLGREGLKPGCYVHGKGGREFSFEVAYSHYAWFFDELYKTVYGLDANGVEKEYRRHRGKPFIEFLDVASLSQGDTIGPKMCAKLHGDFVAFARTAKKGFLVKDLAFMWDIYCNFHKALKIASDRGFVCYW